MRVTIDKLRRDQDSIFCFSFDGRWKLLNEWERITWATHKTAKNLCIWRVKNISFMTQFRFQQTNNNHSKPPESWKSERDEIELMKSLLLLNQKHDDYSKLCFFSFIDRSSFKPFQFRSTFSARMLKLLVHIIQLRNKFFFIMLKTSQTWMEIGNVNWWMRLTKSQKSLFFHIYSLVVLFFGWRH